MKITKGELWKLTKEELLKETTDNKVWDYLDMCTEIMGSKAVLGEVISTLPTNEAMEIVTFIMKNNDIDKKIRNLNNESKMK